MLTKVTIVPDLPLQATILSSIIPIPLRPKFWSLFPDIALMRGFRGILFLAAGYRQMNISQQDAQGESDEDQSSPLVMLPR